MENQLYALLTDSLSRREMRVEDIPNLDLYMDQVITLFDTAFGDGKEKVLTKTMINNYTKDGVLRPVKGKKYTREHLLRMLLLYLLKPTLTIGEIKQLLCGLELDEKGLEQQYQRYLDGKEELAQKSCALLREMLPQEEMDKEQLLPLILNLAWISRSAGDMCSKLVEEYFPE